MAKAARGGRDRGRRRTVTPGAAPRPAPPRPADPWAQLALVVLGGVLAARLGVNALEPFPVLSGEAEAWALGRAPGYPAQPPLVPWLVRGVTEVLGDTLFALRLPGAVAHGLIGWLIFLTGRRLWDGRTGFWAAAGYTAAPGVGLSAMILSPEPVLMLFWAGALYALVRAAEDGGRGWWLALGGLVGGGALASHGMAAFALAALGYGVFAARGRDWKGTGIAAAAALALLAPHLAWSWRQGLAGFGALAGAVAPASGAADPWPLVEFLALQLGLVGPVFFAAILIAVWHRPAWRGDWGMRLVAWQTLPLVLALAALAAAGGGAPHWAAPAYVGGALMAARWLLLAGGMRALRAQLAVGVAASLILWSLAGLYAGQADALTRRLDPYRAARLSQPFCELALGVMAEEGAEALLSDDPRRLAECMFYGGLGWREVAVWNPDGPESHPGLAASLKPGDGRRLLLAVTHDGGGIAGRFTEAREIETGRLATHIDRWVPFSLWVVRGYRGR